MNEYLLKEAIDLFFSKWDGCEYSVKERGVLLKVLQKHFSKQINEQK